MRKKLLFIGFLVVLGTSNKALAQEKESFDKKEIVTSLADLLLKNYVFADKGAEMSKRLLADLEEKKYDNITDPAAFAKALETTLESVVRDRHLRIVSDKERVEAIRSGQPQGLPKLPENKGFHKVEILEDSIGYLDLRAFLNIALARDEAKKAMDQLMKANALIIDLRQNGGGSPSMVSYIANYLLPNERIHLNSFYFRPRDQTTELWTSPEQASVHNTEMPVFILTSDRTGSAAEGFAYHLKHLERATIVGENTAGAAHPGGFVLLGEVFAVFIPSGRPTNPITNDNWEGTGVIPHIKVKQEEALEKALMMAKVAISSK